VIENVAVATASQHVGVLLGIRKMINMLEGDHRFCLNWFLWLEQLRRQ